MSSADAVIAALRTGHDDLAAMVTTFSADDLARPSGAAEWDISQVLSHLGSGAEIMKATVQAALDGQPNPGRDFNHSVWDRWNAMSRDERAAGFLAANEATTSLFESLDADTRENLRVDVGFLPAPVDVASTARLRLSELALHSWDIRVEFDDKAVLAADAAEPMLPQTTQLLSWIAKADQVDGKHGVIKVSITDPDAVFALHLGDRISTDADLPDQLDGTLELPAEAWLRLVAGRLAPKYTPSTVVATGAADLDLLRRVFAGY
jgi:uncharacterized protein (TIGR03083 family)